MELKKVSNKLKNVDSTSKLPWVEKYRPQTIAEIGDHKDIQKMLLTASETHDIPHMLFYGPPGTGKTSTILAFCRELFGKNLYSSRVFELNASEDRGINVVRDDIKQYARYQVSNGLNDYGKPAPPFKFIILDEADSMTKEAQNALRIIIEQYSTVTRFCFICNYVTNIIEPIKSRCSMFQFRLLNNESMIKILTNISTVESLNFENDDVLNFVIKISKGDMRKAIMILQNLKYIQNMHNRKVNIDDVLKVGCHLKRSVCVKILDKILTAPNLLKIKNITDNIIANAYSIDNFIIQLTELIQINDKLDEIQKARIINQLSTIQTIILDGGDEYLQLLNCLSYIFAIHKKMQ
jgi:replication factor C subunit 2/4